MPKCTYIKKITKTNKYEKYKNDISILQINRDSSSSGLSHEVRKTKISQTDLKDIVNKSSKHGKI